jgi:hypothetical protein
MLFKPKSMAALDIALAGLPSQARVEVDPGIEVSAKTVGELRKLSVWPENLAVHVPQARHPDMAIHVSRANHPTRVVPKS